MAQRQILVLGSANNDGLGAPLRDSLVKVQTNFENLFARRPVTTRTVAGTLVIGDADSIIEVNSATAVTLTVPPDSSVLFDVGSEIEFLQIGVGQFTLAPGAGVTINRPSTLTSRVQWSSGVLRKRAANFWVFGGDTT